MTDTPKPNRRGSNLSQADRERGGKSSAAKQRRDARGQFAGAKTTHHAHTAHPKSGNHTTNHASHSAHTTRNRTTEEEQEEEEGRGHSHAGRGDD